MEPVLKVFWNAFSLVFLIFFTVKNIRKDGFKAEIACTVENMDQ